MPFVTSYKPENSIFGQINCTLEQVKDVKEQLYMVTKFAGG